jgi:hypothetical protein
MLEAKTELLRILSDPEMSTCVVLVFSNKNDVEGAMSIEEAAGQLGLYDLKTRTWHAESTCALTGEGVWEGNRRILKSTEIFYRIEMAE